MTVWILVILTLGSGTFGRPVNHYPEVTYIKGFSSEQKCNKAGERVHKSFDHITGVVIRYSCVEQYEPHKK